jgi:hypothetical protein
MDEQRPREIHAMATLGGDPAPVIVNTRRGQVEYVACGRRARPSSHSAAPWVATTRG